MKVKIIKSDNLNDWYHNHIGEIFDVYGDDTEVDTYYVVKQTHDIQDYYFIINKSDAIICDRRKKIEKIFHRLTKIS